MLVPAQELELEAGCPRPVCTVASPLLLPGVPVLQVEV